VTLPAIQGQGRGLSVIAKAKVKTTMAKVLSVKAKAVKAASFSP